MLFFFSEKVENITRGEKEIRPFLFFWFSSPSSSPRRRSWGGSCFSRLPSTDYRPMRVVDSRVEIEGGNEMCLRLCVYKDAYKHVKKRRWKREGLKPSLYRKKESRMDITTSKKNIKELQTPGFFCKKKILNKFPPYSRAEMRYDYTHKTFRSGQKGLSLPLSSRLRPLWNTHKKI